VPEPVFSFWLNRDPAAKVRAGRGGPAARLPRMLAAGCWGPAASTAPPGALPGWETPLVVRACSAPGPGAARADQARRCAAAAAGGRRAGAGRRRPQALQRRAHLVGAQHTPPHPAQRPGAASPLRSPAHLQRWHTRRGPQAPRCSCPAPAPAPGHPPTPPRPCPAAGPPSRARRTGSSSWTPSTSRAPPWSARAAAPPSPTPAPPCWPAPRSRCAARQGGGGGHRRLPPDERERLLLLASQ
jgi:hypothetical protein